jgi:hypothetical protein
VLRKRQQRFQKNLILFDGNNGFTYKEKVPQKKSFALFTGITLPGICNCIRRLPGAVLFFSNL